MNQSEDWDVIWRWQWFRRPLWEDHFANSGHPEGRPARVTPIWDWVLKQHNASRVLDCNAGLGLRTILLSELGFNILGTDVSTEAINYATQLAESRNSNAVFKIAKWNDIGDQYNNEFDAIINDAFVWTQTRSDLRFAFHNFAAALKPGGILIFTGPDESSQPGDRDQQLAHAWQATNRFSIRNDYERDGTAMTLMIARDLEDHAIVENYLFLIREASELRMENASICNTFQWTWDDFKHVAQEANFSKIESVKVPVGKREHIVNVATK